jgi:DNA invertase Pin-like site-specific DNA recombinase
MLVLARALPYGMAIAVHRIDLLEVRNMVRNSTATLTPAAGYIRRSTEKQEASLKDQRREIEAYAAQHGYAIVRWFEDDGISGDDTKRRTGFQELHQAACDRRRDFEAILVWDQDRFGRFNSMEAGYWIHPLMEAGIVLVTVNEGPVNWHDFSGRMIYSMKQEGKHQFLRDLSRNTARGQISIAQAGYLTGQAAPYGYDRMLIDERGEPMQRVRNGEQFAKPRAWHVTLVPSDDPERIKTVRWIFEVYAETDIGLRTMADRLNARGLPGPGGDKWWMNTIREILRNEAYVGTFVWAKRRLGKYHRVAAGEIRPRTDGAGVKINPREERIIRPGAFPALVGEAVFARVQEKLTLRKKRTCSHRKTNGDRYLLSGIVICGHCGKPMYGTAKSRTKAGKRYAYPKYICSSYQAIGRGSGCLYHTVDQAELLAFVMSKLQEAVFHGGRKEGLRERVVTQLAARQATDPSAVKQLRARVAELDRELEHGTKRLLRAPDNLADLLATELSNVRRQRDRLAGELARADAATEHVDVDAVADRIVSRLSGLADELETAPPDRMRELLRRLVGRIELWFDHVPRGKRVECPLSRGSIELRQDRVLFGLDSRGDRRLTFLNELDGLYLMRLAIAQSVELSAELFAR